LLEIAVADAWRATADALGADRSWAVASVPEARVRLVCGVGRHGPDSGLSFDGRTRRDFLALPIVLVQLGLGGALDVEIGGRWRRLEPGTIGAFSIPGANAMRLPPGGSSLHAYAAIYHEYATPRLAAALSAGRLLGAAPDDPAVAALCDLLLRARAGEGDADREERDIFGFMLALERLLRRSGESTAERWRGIVEALAEARAPAVPSVPEMAAACGVSPAHFVRRYRALTGATPAAHVRDLRLARAMRLLIETDAPLKSLAWRCGFADAQGLAHAFRRRFGVTPGAFRARHRWI
jgi:AraC-like DNA-binding protein